MSGVEQDEDDRESFIYFIEAVGVNLIKIGKADDVSKRLAALQTASPHELVLLEVIRDKPPWERVLHEHFKHDRVRGEWFTASERLREFIRQIPESRRMVDEMASQMGIH